MSVYNLNHLEGTMVGERMQKQKSEFFPRKPRRTKWQPWASFNLQLLFTHFNFSDSAADCCYVIRTSGWQSLAMRGYSLQKQNGLHPRVLQSVWIRLLLPSHESQPRASPWNSGSILFVWVSILITAISEGEQNSSKKIIYCCPFLVGVPEDARKPLCFHNIPKSWAYWLSVLILTVCPSDNWHAQVRAWGK